MNGPSNPISDRDMTRGVLAECENDPSNPVSDRDMTRGVLAECENDSSNPVSDRDMTRGVLAECENDSSNPVSDRDMTRGVLAECENDPGEVVSMNRPNCWTIIDRLGVDGINSDSNSANKGHIRGQVRQRRILVQCNPRTQRRLQHRPWRRHS